MSLISGLERPRIQGDVDCVFLESVQRDDLKRSLMGGCEDDVGCGAILVRQEPVARGHTPPIAGHEPRESIVRHRGDQVVADPPLVLEKLGGDYRADRVATQILGTRVAAAITKETGYRVGATGCKRSA
jgi:hypothetical protein